MTVPKVRIEELLRLEEERRAEIQDLYDHAPCGYHSVDAADRIVRINATELSWLGYRRAEVEGRMRITDLLVPNCVPAYRESLARLVTEPGLRLEREATMRRKDGSLFEAWVASSAVFDPQGRFVMTRCSVFDNSARKKVEEALRRSEASLANAQRIAHMGDWAWDLESGELRWSDEIYRIFGTEPKEFGATYEAFLAFVHPEDRPTLERMVHQALHMGVPYNLEHRIVLRDGTVRIVHEQAVVERTPVGTPIKMCGVVQDVTELRTAIAASERRAAELTKALELEELRTSLINAVSHDLRQPITSIVGYCEVLIDELHGPLNELQNRDLNLILRSAGRLKAMVDDLLDAARIQAGTFRANLEPGDLAPVAQAVVEAFQPMADLEGVKLSSAIDGDLPWPAIDPGQIERVFSNLVHNALKFTPPPGTVSVRLYPDEGGVVFEVRDSGPGIAQDDIPKLFQRFSQVGRGPRLEGAGLGLSICKAIVEAHHGRVGVESEAGRGARFWVWLPVAPSSRTS